MPPSGPYARVRMLKYAPQAPLLSPEGGIYRTENHSRTESTARSYNPCSSWGRTFHLTAPPRLGGQNGAHARNI